MKREAVNVTANVRPVDSGMRVFILGFMKTGFFHEPEADLSIAIGSRIIFDVTRTDTEEPVILFVDDKSKRFWTESISEKVGVYDIKPALDKYNGEEVCQLYANESSVYLYSDGQCWVRYTDSSVLIEYPWRGIYFLGNTPVEGDAGICITKYVSFQKNKNRNIRKVITKLIEGRMLAGSEFTQLLLNRVREYRTADEEFMYTQCSMSTNVFQYDCFNRDVSITMNNGRKYLITFRDMFLNELCVTRLLAAANAGDLEDVIIQKYPSTLIPFIKSNMIRGVGEQDA